MMFRRFTINLALRVIIVYSTVSVLWVDIMPAQAGIIFLCSDQGLVVRSVVGNSIANSVEGQAIAIEMAQAITMAPHVLHIYDTHQDVRFGQGAGDRWNTRSLLGVPLKRHNQLIGVLQVEWTTLHP
jgi:GAF domain-containing protein